MTPGRSATCRRARRGGGVRYAAIAGIHLRPGTSDAAQLFRAHRTGNTSLSASGAESVSLYAAVSLASFCVTPPRCPTARFFTLAGSTRPAPHPTSCNYSVRAPTRNGSIPFFSTPRAKKSPFRFLRIGFGGGIALIGPPTIELAAMRQAAARQLGKLLGGPIDIDPAAEPDTQKAKRELFADREEVSRTELIPFLLGRERNKFRFTATAPGVLPASVKNLAVGQRGGGDTRKLGEN